MEYETIRIVEIMEDLKFFFEENRESDLDSS